MMQTQIKTRNGAIDFWKFVFSIMVVQFHSSNLTEIKTTPFVGAAIAVEFFFLVSGYLMAASISRYQEADIRVGRDSRNFMLHKIKGLCPEIFIAWAIGFVVQHIAKKNVSLSSLVKDLMTGVWDMFFLRESGLEGFKANPAAWYISAMLLAMLVLVPLFLKDREVFLNVWAPVLAIASLGYLSKNVGDLRGPTDWLGFCYKGFLRAVGELCMGVICWGICCEIKKLPLSGLGKRLLTALELGCYAGVILWSYKHKGSQMDFVMLLLFAVGVVVTFSGHSLLSSFFNKPLVYFLGKISFPVYLSHNYWSHAFVRIYPEQTYAQLYPKYVVATILTTVVIYLTARALRGIAPAFFGKCRSLLLETENK
ncbi:hypothetical protein C823_004340 [Eubacterium plexicaudatum ASF492]|uniref:Acyltransferase 3 domain-containing protein n=1 Tax=Eubacterium plexicaudatum ASF492 TaxID=1235802 RepID=N2A5F5_9FIRM|nr:hypothetical protein C823_004340 [Eubacterium plexicaudatum ASF492]